MVAACPFPYPRGTPVRILRMAQTLADSGHEVHVVTYHLGEKTDSYNFFTHRIPNLKFYKKMSPGPTYLKLLVVDLFLTLKLLRLHRQIKFDVIHAHHFEGLLASLPIYIFGDTPVVFDVHTLLNTELHHYDLFVGKSLKKKIGEILDRFLPKLSDHVICVSEQIRKYMKEEANIPPDKISVILNGLEIEKFLNKETMFENQSHNKTVLGYAGNLAEYQGFDILLYALNILRKNNPDITLHVYTNDSIEPYQPIIDELGLGTHIRLISTTFQNLPDHLSRTDVLLNPRVDGAGVPIKLYNYMASGRPLVTFAGSSHVVHHGKTGWVVAGDSPQSFADGIFYLLSNKDLAEKIGRNAQTYIKKNFSWHARGEKIIKIYEHISKSSRS